MLIEIKSVSPTYKEGKWTKLNLEYVRDGTVASRKLVDIGETKPVFAILKGASPGESYEITVIKDPASDFYNWVSATKTEATSVPVAKTSVSAGAVKSTYETAEERATKQLSIVRQVALKLAVELGIAEGDHGVASAVLKAAKFEDYIVNGYAKGTAAAPKADSNGDDFVDDNPFGD